MSRFLPLLSWLAASVLCGLAAGQSTATTVVVANPNSVSAGGTVGLTATVQPPGASISSGNAATKPSGTISFLDGTTPLHSSPITLTPNIFAGATFAQTFGTPNSGAKSGELTGDLNGDGVADLLIYGTDSADLLVQSFVNNGKGGYSAGTLQTFTINSPGISYPSVEFTPALVDLNGDGKLDLLYGLVVAHGNGDGTFATPTAVSFLASGFVTAFAADLNGDGATDILAVNSTAYPGLQFSVTSFINDGAGTFALAGTVLVGAGGMSNIFTYNPTFIDLNGDGKLDVVLQWNVVLIGKPQLSVLLNNGDGSFGSPIAVTVPYPPGIFEAQSYPTASGDVNGDGKQDLLLTTSDTNGSGTEDAIILLGNGDGTFENPLYLSLPTIVNAYIDAPDVVITDADLDGKLDLAFGNGQLALGNGDGTFKLATPLFPLTASGQTTSYPAYPVTLLAIPGNSAASLVFLLTSGNPSPSNDSVFTPQATSSAALSLTTLAVGTHSITAHYSGDKNYSADTSAATTVTVSQAASATALTSSANPSFAGQSVTFTAKVTSNGPAPTGNVTFTSGSTTLATAALSGGSAAITISSLTTAGTQAITASYGGDDNIQPSSAGISQVVSAAFVVAPDGSTTTLSVQSGKTVSAPINVTGAAGFSGTISFACSGLPANASCSFSPATILVSGTSAVPSLLSVNTSANTAMSELRPGTEKEIKSVTYALGLGSLIIFWPLRRRKLRLWVMLFCSLALVSVGLNGCAGSGSGGPKTAPGTYNFAVTASSGNVQVQSSYTLVVQ